VRRGKSGSTRRGRTSVWPEAGGITWSPGSGTEPDANVLTTGENTLRPGFPCPLRSGPGYVAAPAGAVTAGCDIQTV
jgi:hypothetical protein